MMVPVSGAIGAGGQSFAIVSPVFFSAESHVGTICTKNNTQPEVSNSMRLGSGATEKASDLSWKLVFAEMVEAPQFE